MSSFYELPPAQWAKKNRNLASEARDQAARASGRERQSLLMLAHQWEQLALEADAVQSR